MARQRINVSFQEFADHLQSQINELREFAAFQGYVAHAALEVASRDEASREALVDTLQHLIDANQTKPKIAEFLELSVRVATGEISAAAIKWSAEYDEPEGDYIKFDPDRKWFAEN